MPEHGAPVEELAARIGELQTLAPPLVAAASP
jgi:hypothetical protein